MSRYSADVDDHDMDMGCPNRPSHKQVEQYRRMKAKEYFEELRDLLPSSRDTKCDRNRILQEAIEYVKELKGLTPPRDRCGKRTLREEMDGWTPARGLSTEAASEECRPAFDRRTSLLFLERQSNVHDALRWRHDRDSKARKGDEDDDGMQFDMKEDAGRAIRLSHKQVERRRRQLAKSHFEELRALLHDAARFDKNTILLHTIRLIRNYTGKVCTSSSDFSPSPTNEGLSRSAPASWRSQLSTEAGDSSYCGLSGLSQAASSLSSASDLSDLLSSSCPEGRGRKRSPSSVLPDDGYERKRRVSDVLEEDGPRVKLEAVDADQEALAFQALKMLSECAERLSLQSARNTPASTPKIVPRGAPEHSRAFQPMSLTALCS
jgi:hypothetical protein